MLNFHTVKTISDSINIQPKSQKQNNPPAENNSSKLESELIQSAEINKNLVNFKGRFFRLNKKDILFLSTITYAFGLPVSYLEKLKETLSNFLQTNNYASMEDFAGEDNIETQAKLTEELQEILNIEKDDYDKISYLTDKVIERCDSGENYFPEDNDYEEAIKKQQEEEKLLTSGIRLLIQEEKKNDEKFINAISFAFQFNKDEQDELKRIIDYSLEKNKAITIKQLSSIHDIETVFTLANMIAKRFNLNNYDASLISTELINRIMRADDYIPVITPLDRNKKISERDNTVFREILDSYDIDKTVSHKLRTAMKHDAFKFGFNSIFDLFTPQNNTEQFKETNTVLDSSALKNHKNDLIVDFYINSKNLDAVKKKADIKAAESAAKYRQETVIIYLMNKKFKLSEKDISKIRHYFASRTCDYTRHNDIWKTAFEISEILNLNCKSISEIIKTTNNMSEEELNNYNIESCMELISRKTKP